MGVPTTGAIGGYVDGTVVVSAAADVEIQANIALLRAVITQILGQSATSPDFDQIPPHIAEKLRVEIDAMAAAISAAPDV